MITTMKSHMESTTYQTGDYVYFDVNPASPFQIRRIEELNKTSNGNVEAKVMCFYRRRDLPPPLVQLADKHQFTAADDSSLAINLKKIWIKLPPEDEKVTETTLPNTQVEEQQTTVSYKPSHIKTESLTAKQHHQLRQRELFLSRQIDTLPATMIRGKCSVTLLNETESLSSYLSKEDTFFYSLVFDPTLKTLLADKGEIRVGTKYQAESLPTVEENHPERKSEDLETLVWTPNHSLTDRRLDQFLVISRSVGTFARALDCSSSVKQPSLHMSAAAASRDVTLFHAMDTLHKHNYSIESAMCSLVPSTGPLLCRDEMEEWSAPEANLFEEALDKYGKDFNDIRQDFLSWKTVKSLVEYYYMWKTTDRYVQQKRQKVVEAESKLKQLTIPNIQKPSSSLYSNLNVNITSHKNLLNGTSNGEFMSLHCGKPCESCLTTTSTEWHPWGPPHLSSRVCHGCWNYWKKYGGLKVASQLNDTDIDVVKRKPSTELDDSINFASNRPAHRCSIVNCGKEFKIKAHLAKHYAVMHGITIRSGSPRPIMKTRTAFFLHTTPATKLSRRLCSNIIQSKKAARQPSFAINIQAVRLEFSNAIGANYSSKINNLETYKKKDRGTVTGIANRLSNSAGIVEDWLILTPKTNIINNEKISFPKPPKAPDGSLVYDRIPNKQEINELVTNIGGSPGMKRPLADDNVQENQIIAVPPPAKRPNKDPMPAHRPSSAQFAEMVAAAEAAGQPFPRRHINGKPKIAQMKRTGSGRKQVISWMDAPDDVYFRSTEASRKSRRRLFSSEIRKAARRPWRQISVTTLSAPIVDEQVVVLE